MRKFLALAILAVSTIAASAGPFEDGASAYRRGDYSHAIDSWRGLAATNATIQNNYGVMYMDGKGVARNYNTAITWFSRSAANGSSLGQNNLGGMYRDGRGVSRDYGKAATFFQAAAVQGNPAAQVNLGLMLMNGQGVRQDLVHAYMWFDLASLQGVAQANQNRAILHQHMNAQAIAQADQLASRCRQQNFRSCG